MSANLQTVNLLASLEPPEIESYIPYAKLKKILIWWGVVLLVISGFGVWWLINTASQVSVVKKQRDQVAETVKQLQALPDKQVDDQLQKTVDDLANNVDSKKDLLALLSSEESADNRGYSPYMLALAEKIPQDTWLTHFIIADEGVLLAGKAMNTASVASFAHDLGDTKPFAEIRFKRIDIDRDKDKRAVSFEIATSAEMEEQK